MARTSLLDHLKNGGVIVGDGGYVFQLEKRGYVLAGPFTPEVVLENPEAVKQLSRDFARAGSNVIQALTYSSMGAKLQTGPTSATHDSKELNLMAIAIAKEVAKSVDAYVCGGIDHTVLFRKGFGEEVVKREFRKMVEIFVQQEVDFLLGEFFLDIREAVWAVEVLKEASDKVPGGLPVACTMCIGITGDANDVTPEECAVRLASAGADVVGINCNLDPISSLKTIAKMKDGLAAAGLNPFLMMQPCGFHSQDVETSKRGFYDLPEYPFLIEPRLITRVDCYEYARKAFELGVRYIGGCCGFEPYHIRAVALELEKETGKKPPGGRHVSKWGESAKHGAVGHERTGQEYWTSVVPGIGRPKIKPFSPGLT